MRYVLDSCVAVKWFLSEPDSAKAIQLRDEAERRGLIQSPAGSQYLSDLLVYLPELHPSLVLLPRSYELSSQFRIGVYDCLYVALAEREQCALITADSRLVNSLQPTHPFLTSLASLP
jgi:predicted nucleic acid-binding protein